MFAASAWEPRVAPSRVETAGAPRPTLAAYRAPTLTTYGDVRSITEASFTRSKLDMGGSQLRT